VGGLLAQPGLRTVTGMLVGARLARRWQHARAHRFFAAARWHADQLGLAVCDLIVARLLEADAPIRLVAGDTRCKRTGRKVFGAGWPTLRSGRVAGAPRGATTGLWWACWYACRLWPTGWRACRLGARLGQPRHRRFALACQLVGLICQQHPDRQVHLVCDAADAGKALRGLPQGVTVTTRLRADAALLSQLPPPRRPGQRGRPRRKGARLAELIVLAARPAAPGSRRPWPATARRARSCCTAWSTSGMRCSAPSPCGSSWSASPAPPDGDELALVSTDLAATPAELVERSADRWSVEVLFEQSRQVAGVGQARNRTPPHGPAHCPLRPTVREPGRLLVRPARPASRRPLPSTAPVRPGIPPSTPSRWLTCSTRSAASYWPPNFCHLAWSHPPWKNSSTRRQPGPPTRCKVRNSSLGMGVCNIRWRRATR
jgi:hypothetical protein